MFVGAEPARESVHRRIQTIRVTVLALLCHCSILSELKHSNFQARSAIFGSHRRAERGTLSYLD